MKIYYHSDHLGSASFVTDIGGFVVQHLQYLPYGELFVSQRNTEEFDSRYKFTAKELDNETSYTYFGARYYDSELSGWLSVDPMSDERRWVSPYAYCQWNPLILVDPSGMLDGWVSDKNNPDEIYWDPNINSYEEAAQAGVNYYGQQGFQITNEGMLRHYQSNGTISEGTIYLEKVEVRDYKNRSGNKFNKDLAVAWLEQNTGTVSQKNCAKYVRLALEAGGLNTNTIGRPDLACDYGPYLEKLGFHEVNPENFIPQKADIAVFQGYPGGTVSKTGRLCGHIQMYSGERWISDFKQNNFWPGAGYLKNKPRYNIYRWVKKQDVN